MWIRKSELEIGNLLVEKELKNKSVKRPLAFGAAVALLTMTAHYFGFRGGSLRYGYAYTSAIGFSWQTVSVGIFGFFFVFLIALYHQKKGSSMLSGSDHIWRCDSCTELSQLNADRRCMCGGNLEPSEFYTWEED